MYLESYDGRQSREKGLVVGVSKMVQNKKCASVASAPLCIFVAGLCDVKRMPLAYNGIKT